MTEILWETPGEFYGQLSFNEVEIRLNVATIVVTLRLAIVFLIYILIFVYSEMLWE